MLSHNLKLKTVFCLILTQVDLVRISLRYEKYIYIYIFLKAMKETEDGAGEVF